MHLFLVLKYISAKNVVLVDVAIIMPIKPQTFRVLNELQSFITYLQKQRGQIFIVLC